MYLEIEGDFIPHIESSVNKRIVSSKIALPHYQVNETLASSVSGPNEPNPELWLATRAGKMELSCTLETNHRRPYHKSFIDQACSVKMAGYWRLFLRVFGPQFRLDQLLCITQKTPWLLCSSLHLTLDQITNIYCSVVIGCLHGSIDRWS